MADTYLDIEPFTRYELITICRKKIKSLESDIRLQKDHLERHNRLFNKVKVRELKTEYAFYLGILKQIEVKK